jgi:hypothetical protein
MDRKPLSKAERLLGQMRGILAYTPIDQILAGDLHEFFGRLIDQVSQVSRAVQERYWLR